MKMEQSVPKRRHIKFRRRGITQKKTYNNKPIYFDTDVLRQLLGPSGHPQRAKFHPFKTSLSYFLSVLSLTIYKNYNFSRGFVWVWNLVANIEGGTQVEGVWE